MIMTKFSSNTQTYTNGQEIPVLPGCYGFIAINKGDDDLRFENSELLGRPGVGFSGESIAIIDPLCRPFTKRGFTLVFDTAVGVRRFQLTQLTSEI